MSPNVRHIEDYFDKLLDKSGGDFAKAIARNPKIVDKLVTHSGVDKVYDRLYTMRDEELDQALQANPGLKEPFAKYMRVRDDKMIHSSGALNDGATRDSSAIRKQAADNLAIRAISLRQRGFIHVAEMIDIAVSL